MARLLIASVLCFLLIGRCCSQGFIIYDAKDFIKPSWLDAGRSGIEGLKKIRYVAFTGGAGFNLSSLRGDDVFPNKYSGNLWLCGSFYSKTVQLSFKNSYVEGGNYKAKTDSYVMFRTYTPKLQAAIYPFQNTKSYLGQQLRLQTEWAQSFNQNAPGESYSYNANVSLNFGGFLTPTDYRTDFPRTAFLVNYLRGISTFYTAQYGFSLFTELFWVNTDKISNNFYLQFNYNRQTQEGLDMANLARLGIVNELIYNKTRNFTMYIFLNYAADYFSPSNESNLTVTKKTVNLGVFFYLPFYNKMYYKY